MMPGGLHDPRSDAPEPVTPLPCPFCDHDYPEFVDQGSGPPPMQAIVCGWCGAKGPGGLGFERGDVDGAKRAAVKEWNRAPRPQQERQESNMTINWPATYLQAGRDVLGALTEHEKERLVGVPFFDWPITVLTAIDARANELVAQAHEPPPEVMEAFARDCRCCGCCRQTPCPGAMAGGMCDDFACVHEERDLSDLEADDDDEGMSDLPW